MVDKAYTPKEYRDFALSLYPAHKSLDELGPEYFLNVGKVCGLLTVAADQIEELEKRLSEMRAILDGAYL